MVETEVDFETDFSWEFWNQEHSMYKFWEKPKKWFYIVGDSNFRTTFERTKRRIKDSIYPVGAGGWDSLICGKSAYWNGGV